MKKWIPRISLVLLGMVVGLGVGASVVFHYSQKAFQVGGELVALNYSAWEGEEAYYHYKKGDYDLAEQAFSHYLKVLSGFDEINDKMGRSIVPAKADISFTHLRLGKIAERNGDQKKAEDHFNKAVEFYSIYSEENGRDSEYSIEEMLSLIEKIDSNQSIPERRPFSAVLFVSEE